VSFDEFLKNELIFIFHHRTLAYDYEALQFVADFKATPNDPTALYMVSSKFHRFFLKNVSPFEVNTRILRIGNVVKSSPYAFAPAFPAIPQYTQNSLIPSPQPPFPTSVPGFPQFPVANASPLQSPNYSFYNFVNQYPTNRPIFPSPSTAPAYAPTQPIQPTQVAFPTYNNQEPVTSFYKFRGSTPYAFDRFDLVDRRNSYSWQPQLNAGETLPSQPTAYANFHFGGLTGEIYRQTRNASSFRH
jgi:hypothetical protein